MDRQSKTARIVRSSGELVGQPIQVRTSNDIEQGLRRMKQLYDEGKRDLMMEIDKNNQSRRKILIPIVSVVPPAGAKPTLYESITLIDGAGETRIYCTNEECEKFAYALLERAFRSDERARLKLIAKNGRQSIVHGKETERGRTPASIPLGVSNRRKEAPVLPATGTPQQNGPTGAPSQKALQMGMPGAQQPFIDVERRSVRVDTAGIVGGNFLSKYLPSVSVNVGKRATDESLRDSNFRIGIPSMLNRLLPFLPKFNIGLKLPGFLGGKSQEEEEPSPSIPVGFFDSFDKDPSSRRVLDLRTPMHVGQRQALRSKKVPPRSSDGAGQYIRKILTFVDDATMRGDLLIAGVYATTKVRSLTLFRRQLVKSFESIRSNQSKLSQLAEQHNNRALDDFLSVLGSLENIIQGGEVPQIQDPFLKAAAEGEECQKRAALLMGLLIMLLEVFQPDDWQSFRNNVEQTFVADLTPFEEYDGFCDDIQQLKHSNGLVTWLANAILQSLTF